MSQKTLDYEHMATLGCDVERSPAVLALDVNLEKLEFGTFLPSIMAVKPSNTTEMLNRVTKKLNKDNTNRISTAVSITNKLA